MTIPKDRVIQGFDFIGDLAIGLGKLGGAHAKPALAIGLVLKGCSRALKADDAEDLDSILARIRMPRHVLTDWSYVVDLDTETSTGMDTPSAKALGKAIRDEDK